MIYIFLPAFNEEVALPRLVKKFADQMQKEKEPYRLVVFDDGSADKTHEAAMELSKSYPMDVLQHEKNAGLGLTMRHGLEYLAEKVADTDWVVTLDCDDTHEPRYLTAALEKIRQGYDIVILSRYAKGGGEQGLSPLKSFLSGGAGLFLKIFFPIKGVKEYSCNYRVYRGALIKKALQRFGGDLIRLPHRGFVVTPEILIKMRMLGAKITESPFMLYYDQKPTKSTNKPLKTVGGYFALVWHYFGRS
ncbi:MAG: glycosyltransferase family 2 protein [Candidatus Omnitrophica bacterium]|nr:glycosyltransferase family 2 protein [Candidatus Omnitrophota bacterium]